MKKTILIIEDRASMAGMLKEAIEAGGFRVVTAKDGTEGMSLLKEERFDLVLTDLKLPGRDGIGILGAVKEESPLTPVIIMTAYGTVETAVSAMKEGAYDFITKPFDIDHLLILIGRALENRRLITENLLLREEFSSRLRLPTIIGRSEGIKEVARNIRKVAPTKTTVLILGESGTGKELFARAVHHLSPRKDFPFVPINCAAIPHGLLESELFGYEKGAFTGAGQRKLGKFELAEKGTVFLDEVGELDPSLQVKLLRALQECEIERIGGAKAIKTDIRVVAASNKDLGNAVAEKKFREDLYYRLNVFPIRIPPLRERKDDIPLLAEYFLKKYLAELKAGEKRFSPETSAMLANNGWRGNVRELENAIERAIILCEGRTILPEHVSPGPQTDTAAEAGGLADVSRGAVRAAETERIKTALRDAGGNKTKAAGMLKVSYKTLLTKIKEYGIQ